MANPGCLSKRLALAINQSPSARITCCPHPLASPKVWVRTITSSSNRQRNQKPLVSFGKENDNVLAPYIQRTKSKDNSLPIRQRPTEKPTNDDYEIGQFVDRSKSSIQEIDNVSGWYDLLPEGPDTKQNVPVRFSQSRRQNDGPVIDNRGSQGFKTRNKEYLNFTADTSFSGSRTRSSRRTTDEADPNASKGTGRQLVKKVTEDPEKWTIQKNALKEKFKEGWQPRKKLSPDAQEGIRGLHEQDPITYSTEVLAKQFKQSPEAIRRILKSKWQSQQSPEKLQERRERWAKRHDRIWDAKAEIGQRPPRRRDKEVEDPDKFEQDLERRRILGEI